MRRSNIVQAIAEAERFIAAAREAVTALDQKEDESERNARSAGLPVLPRSSWTGPPLKESGKLRRRSMDLTRVLAEMRKP